MNFIKAYLGFLVTFLVIDAVWISTFVKPLYERDVGHLLSDSPNVIAAVIFYLGYAAGVVILAVQPATSKLNALMLGGLFGLLAYGTFTVTNYALLEGWTVTIVTSDLIWGALLTGVSACVGYFTSGRSSA